MIDILVIYLPEVRIVCELILIGVCFWFCAKYRNAMKESALISEAGRNFLKGERVSVVPAIRSTEGRSLLRLLQITGARVRREESIQDSVEELELGENSSIQELGASLIATVENHSIVRPKAVKIFIRKAGKLEVLSEKGLTSRRFERIIYELVENFEFGASGQEPVNDDSSLKSFGINQQFCFRFFLNENQKSYEIILWLGFQEIIGSNFREGKIAIDSLIKKSEILVSQYEKITKLEKDLGDERDTFLGISHDLRAPGITALYLIRELQSRGALSALDRSSYQDLEVLILEQLSLIQDFLDIERSRNSQIDVRAMTFDGASFIAELSASPIVRCQNKNIALRLEIHGTGLIIFDRVHLKRIMLNLLSNAFKYTTSGEVTLGLREKGVDELEFFVSDTGRGVPQEMKGLLFSRFQRLNAPNNISGSGIGLSASQLLAEKNGAELIYSPRDEGGSTFSIVVKKSAESPLPVNRQPVKITSPITRDGDVVLVLEDDEATCRLYSRILAANGFEIEIQSTIQNAWARISSGQKYSALISDFKLSDGDCFSLLKDICQRGVSIPTLVISGMTEWSKSQRQTREVMERVFNVKFLEKPIEREQFKRELFQLLDGSLSEVKELNLR